MNGCAEDEDQDGFLFYEECDDKNEDINPDAVEISGNGIDENCDGDDFPVNTEGSVLPRILFIYPNPSPGRIIVEYSEAAPLNVFVSSLTGSDLT